MKQILGGRNQGKTVALHKALADELEQTHKVLEKAMLALEESNISLNILDTHPTYKALGQMTTKCNLSVINEIAQMIGKRSFDVF